MVAVLAAVVLGIGAGFAARGHDRILLAIAIACPVLTIAAFAAQLIPGGATECVGTLDGANTCRAVAAVSGWSDPVPYVIAATLAVLSFAPLLSLRSNNAVAVGVAAVLSGLPQVISWGFSDWAPALLAMVTVAVALAIRPRTAGAHGGEAPI